MFLLVPEGSRHTAAAGVEIDDFRARNAPQQFGKRIHANERTLMAVPLHEDSIRASAETGFGLLEAFFQIFFECKATIGDSPRLHPHRAVEKGRVIVLDRQYATRLTGDNRNILATGSR